MIEFVHCGAVGVSCGRSDPGAAGRSHNWIQSDRKAAHRLFTLDLASAEKVYIRLTILDQNELVVANLCLNQIEQAVFRPHATSLGAQTSA